jgi:hypothetical protein
MADDRAAHTGTRNAKTVALGSERMRRDDPTPLRGRLRPIQASVTARPPTGLKPTRRSTMNSAAIYKAIR